MADPLASDVSDRKRHRLIAACGVLIILLAAGAALLPVVDRGAGAAIVGSMLFVAGLIETFAGKLHQQAKGLSMLAGAVTTLAALLLLFNPAAHIAPAIVLVTGWLLVRSVVLLFAGRYSAGSVRMWTLASAGMDLFLAVVLLLGLSIAALVVAWFGPTDEIVAGFAWVLALSFAVTGSMLLEIASCERESAE